jgi:hypothetical protein
MKYVSIKDGKFTGVVYDELTPNVVTWADATEGISLLAVPDDAGHEEGDDVPECVLSFAVRAERDAKIEAVRWRIERAKDEAALGIPLTEPLEPLLRYVQKLRDIPQQAGFPEKVEWPVL